MHTQVSSKSSKQYWSYRTPPAFACRLLGQIGSRFVWEAAGPTVYLVHFLLSLNSSSNTDGIIHPGAMSRPCPIGRLVNCFVSLFTLLPVFLKSIIVVVSIFQAANPKKHSFCVLFWPRWGGYRGAHDFA